MRSDLAKRSARILIAEPNMTLRAAQSQALRELGFKNITVTSDIKAVIGMLESDTAPDWLITSPMLDLPVNVMQLLTLVVKTESLQNMLVSLVLEDADRHILPNAFEMGLFSCHAKSANLAGAKKEFRQLLQIGAAEEWEACLIAANYARKVLRKGKHYDHLFEFESRLGRQFPKHHKLTIPRAEAQFLLGNDTEAVLTLKHAQSVDKDLADAAAQLIERYKNRAAGDDDEGEVVDFAEQYGLDMVVVVDSDESVRNMLDEVLRGLGVFNVQCFANGQEALEWLEDQIEPNLIIQEWRIPILTGHAFLQRLRAHGFETVPVIVYSSVVKEQDRSIIREMGVADIIEKPLSKDNLTSYLKAVIEQESSCEDIQTIERQFRLHTEAGELKTAEELLKKYEQHETTTDSQVKVLRAEMLYHAGEYADAKNIAIEALNASGDSLILLNLIGRILMKLKEFDLAKQFLARAQSIAPDNIDRLCNLAETDNELGDDETAETHLNNVRKIDGDSERLVQAEARIAINRGDTEVAKGLIEKMSSSIELVSYLNNKAVHLVQEGKEAESVELYTKALKSIPADKKDMQAMILYNLGLACARIGDAKAADRHLDAAARFKDSPVAAKLASLSKRVKDSVRSGKPLELRLQTGEPILDAVSPDDFVSNPTAELPIAENIKVGEMCCHRLFVSPEGIDAHVAELIKVLPKFAIRESLYSNKKRA